MLDSASSYSSWRMLHWEVLFKLKLVIHVTSNMSIIHKGKNAPTPFEYFKQLIYKCSLIHVCPALKCSKSAFQGLQCLSVKKFCANKKHYCYNDFFPDKHAQVEKKINERTLSSRSIHETMCLLISSGYLGKYLNKRKHVHTHYCKFGILGHIKRNQTYRAIPLGY